jgi:hypothetical protein
MGHSSNITLRIAEAPSCFANVIVGHLWVECRLRPGLTLGVGAGWISYNDASSRCSSHSRTPPVALSTRHYPVSQRGSKTAKDDIWPIFAIGDKTGPERGSKVVRTLKPGQKRHSSHQGPQTTFANHGGASAGRNP